MPSLSAVLTRWVVRSPGKVIGAGLLFALLALVIAYQRLSFTVDRTTMLDPQHPVQKDWLAYRREFQNLSDFVVVVRGEPSAARAAVDELGTRLKAEPETFDNVFYKLDLPLQWSLYYLSVPDLQKLARRLRQGRPWLQALARPDGLGSLLHSLARGSSALEVARRLEPIRPLLVAVLRGMVATLESRGKAEVPPLLVVPQADVPAIRELHLEPGQSRSYRTVDNGHAYLLLLTARDRSGSYETDIKTLQRLRQIADDVDQRYSDVDVLLSGEPVINADETQVALGDALRTAGWALGLVGLLLVVAFGELSKPVALIFTLLLAQAWTCGVAGLTVGRLNMLTVNFVTILVGLGITFGIQVVARFRQERSVKDLEDAIASTLAASRGNLVGALATAVAFLALHFTSFRSAGQLGFVTGTGMMLCFLAMVTVLPALLVVMDRGKYEPLPPWRWMGRAHDWLQRRRFLVLTVSLLFSLYSLTWVNRVPFDYNLMHIQPPDAPALRLERYLQRFHYSALYGVSVASNLEEAARLTRAYQADPTVGRVESVTSYLPVEVERKRPLVEKIVEQAKGLNVPHPPQPRSAAELEALFKVYRHARQQLLRACSVWRSQGGADVADEVQRLLVRLDEALDRGNPGPVQFAMRRFESRQFAALRERIQLLQEQSSAPPELLSHLPPAMLSRIISPAGRICVRVFPREDCWERPALARFVASLQRIDPNVTGYPVLVYYYLEDMRKAYAQSARNALIAISVLLLFYFRSLRLTLLALSPKLLGILWMLGMMGALHHGFDAINFLALPLTLGIGLIFGVHVLETRGHSLFADSTGPAIIWSGLATMVGFGSLLMAEHRGLASFGLVMVLGVGANLLTSVVTLPAFLQRETDPR